MWIIIGWTILLLLTNPILMETSFDKNINQQSVSNVIDYTIDKQFLEKNEILKIWYYNLWYYLDWTNDENNDTLYLQYLWEWPLNDLIVNKLWWFYPHDWVISKFINWEDNDKSFAVRVSKDHWDDTWWSALYRIDLIKITKKWTLYQQDTLYTFYR